MENLDDMGLVSAYAATGSEDAFAALVSRHLGFVYSTALRSVRNASLAEDISQAVFIILARKAKSMRKDTILPAWLYRTTRYASADALDREIRRLRREREAFANQSAAADENESAWHQISPVLDEALATLGDKDRTAIILRFLEERNLKDVGRALGTGENTAGMRVARALEKLRRFFTRRGIVLPVAAIAAAISTHSLQAAPVGLAGSVTLAAVKGPAATASALTLVKGALKIMAWTKTKTTAVIAAIALMTTLGTGYVVYLALPHAHSELPAGKVTPEIAFTEAYGIILAPDGSLWAWGDENLGWPVLGIPGVRHLKSLRRIGDENDWVAIAAGNSHNAAIKSDGSLWAWGANFRGQLGDGTKTTRPAPVRSVPGNDWKQVAAGGSHTVALKKDGTLWSWGDNWGGQLGIGSTSNSLTAVQIGTSTNWVKVWADGIENVGLQSDGSLWFWGYTYPVFGDKGKSIPVPTRVSADDNWVDASLGDFRAFAIKSDGTLWTWGADADIYTGADKSMNETPVQVGTETDWRACTSFEGPCALFMKRDGSLWALDDVQDQRARRLGNPKWQLQPVDFRRINLPRDIVAFAGGNHKLGVALMRDGEVRTWGWVLGNLGDAPTHGPFQTREAPVELANYRRW